MAVLGQIFTAVLLFVFWVAVPMTTIMMLSDNPNNGNPSWTTLLITFALFLLPLVIAYLYSSNEWNFFFIGSKPFTTIVTIATLILTGLLAAFTLPNKIRGTDPRVQVINGVVNVAGQPIPGADPATFVILENRSYTKDKDHVFFEGKVLEGVNPSQFRKIQEGKAWEYRDDKTFYYAGQPIAEVDPNSYKRLNTFYATDNNHVIAFSDGKIVFVDGADPKAFQVTKSAWFEAPYGKDKNRVYYNGKVLEGADAQTFEMYEKPDASGEAKDKNHNYLNGEIKK